MILTEKNIALQAIRFLRGHYRFRDRHLDSFFEARTDQVTQSGIIADGFIKFKKTDGSFFIATVESTSMAKEEEIRYRRLNHLLFWDSLAIAFLSSAFLMWGLYYTKKLAPIYGSTYEFWSIVIVSLLVFLAFFWLLLSRLRRYRYIYSIEQFRQYSVDEQWIAYDAAIFPSHDNKYLKELKRQCLKWGIGLMKIDNGQVFPIMTPSREGEFGHRQKEDFFKGGTIIPKLSSKSFGKQIMKYRKGVFNQFFLISGALIILGLIFSKFNHESPYTYWDEERLIKQAEIVDEIGPEEYVSWVTPEFIIPFNNKVKPYLDQDVTIFVQHHKSTPKSPKIFVLTDNQKVRKQINQSGAASCKGIPGSPGDDFIIQLGAYKSLSNAKRRVKLLNEAGITTEIYSCGCLGSKDRLNCVIYVHPYHSPDVAFKKMTTFEKILIHHKTPVEEIWLRSVKEL